MRRLIVVLTVGMLIVPFIMTARAQAPAAPAFANKVLVNNDRVQVQRLSVPAGFRETLQVVPNDQIAIQVTPGDLEVVIDSGGLRLDPHHWNGLWSELVHVIRNAVDGSQTRYKVDARDVLAGNAPALPLQPGDTVFVP